MPIGTWGRRWRMGGLIALAALACSAFEAPAWAQCNRGGSMGSSYGSPGMGNPMMAMQMQRMQAMQQQMYAMQQQIMMLQQQGGGGPSGMQGGSVSGYDNPGMRGGQFGPPNQVAQDEGSPQMRRGRRPPPQQVARGRNKPPKTAVASKSKKPAKKSKGASASDTTVAQRD